MIRTFLINLFLFTAAAGYAQNLPPELPPGHGVCGPITHVLYDCAEGPGYLRITTVNVYGQKVHKTVFIGSRDLCVANTKGLKTTRHLIGTPKLIAVCTETQSTLLRWLVNQYGQMKALPQLQYPKLDECWAEAHALNAVP